MRRDGVMAMRQPAARRRARPSIRSFAVSGVKGWWRVVPPSRTPAMGPSPRASRPRQASAATASRAGVTSCRAVGTFKTLGPATPSWSMATTRSKAETAVRGFCTCTPRVRPWLALRIAMATAVARRPQLTTRSGHGGAGRSLPGVRAAKAIGAAIAPGSSRQGARRLTISSRGFSARALARPRAWVRNPASPVVTYQAVVTPRRSAARPGSAR